MAGSVAAAGIGLASCSWLAACLAACCVADEADERDDSVCGWLAGWLATKPKSVEEEHKPKRS